MASTFIELELIHETCCVCGIAFGITRDLYNRRSHDKKVFYCPNGDSLRYTGKSDAQEIKDAQAYAQRQAERADANHRSLIATKGHLTRAKKRAAAGLCQSCNRTFEDVAKHYATKHPGEAPPSNVKHYETNE